MNEETQKKILVLLGTSLTLNDYIEDLTHDLPLLVKREIKKAYKDMTRCTYDLHAKLFAGMEKQPRVEVAEQIQNINVSFEQWIKENFNDLSPV